MKFEEFVESEKPSGKTSQGWSGFPLWFGDHDDFLEEIDGYSVIDDFLSTMDMDDFLADFSEFFPDYRVIAIVDLEDAEAKNPDFTFDSYAEFFLAVDTSKKERPVLLWTGEGHFENLYESFEEFYSSLEDWKGD